VAEQVDPGEVAAWLRAVLAEVDAGEIAADLDLASGMEPPWRSRQSKRSLRCTQHGCGAG
jgi:hypothetical protein